MNPSVFFYIRIVIVFDDAAYKTKCVKECTNERKKNMGNATVMFADTERKWSKNTTNLNPKILGKEPKRFLWKCEKIEYVAIVPQHIVRTEEKSSVNIKSILESDTTVDTHKVGQLFAIETGDVWMRCNWVSNFELRIIAFAAASVPAVSARTA